MPMHFRFFRIDERKKYESFVSHANFYLLICMFMSSSWLRERSQLKSIGNTLTIRVNSASMDKWVNETWEHNVYGEVFLTDISKFIWNEHIIGIIINVSKVNTIPRKTNLCNKRARQHPTARSGKLHILLYKWWTLFWSNFNPKNGFFFFYFHTFFHFQE